MATIRTDDVREYLLGLRDKICSGFEKVDGKMTFMKTTGRWREEVGPYSHIK